MRRPIVALAVIMPAAALLLATAASAEAYTRPASASAVTFFRNVPDSGYNGTWATDAFADFGTVTNIASKDSSCAAGSYYYAATDNDLGASQTIVGGNSPGETSVMIARSVSVSMAGGFTGITFCADSLSPSSSGVPRYADASTTEGAALAGEIGTAAWYAQYFPAGTTISNFTDPGWSWTYRLFQDPTCGPGYQQWTDGATVPQASSGNIVVLACTPPPPPVHHHHHHYHHHHHHHHHH
ncbi:MAG TPA: hypothetical protein VLX31_04545 [Streptosporangiaceae bacterium]|nr:hypothetical protein [Streptosporangiaceae bacterium]